ncbi:MAG: hypothetical protein AB7K09_12835 [Planctomycetota bacterium]
MADQPHRTASASGSSDDAPSKPVQTVVEQPDPGPISITALAGAIGGVAMIIAFFLPLLIFKADRLSGFHEKRQQLIESLAAAEKVAESNGQITVEQLRGLDKTTNADGERTGHLLERITGSEGAQTVSLDQIRAARAWTDAASRLINVPSLWHLFNIADLLEKDKDRTRALGERIGINDRMLKIVSGVRIGLISLPVAGLVAIAMALVTRFRKLNALFLIIMFLAGIMLVGMSGLFAGYGWACENAARFADTPVQPLLADLPFVVGPGTWAVLGGSGLFVFTAMFGVNRRNVLACYIFYFLLAGGAVAFWVYWIGEQKATPTDAVNLPAPAAPALLTS